MVNNVNSKKPKATKAFDKMQLINKECKYANYRFYLLSIQIQAFLIVLIDVSLYLFIVFYSKWFLVENYKLDTVIPLITFPFILAILACGIHIFVQYKLVRNTTYNIAFSLKQKNSLKTTTYSKVEKDFNKTFLTIHIIGVILHTLTGTVVSVFAVSLLDKNIVFGMGEKLVLFTSIYSFVLGLLWNILGYITDKCVDFKKLFNRLVITSDKERRELHRKIYNNIFLKLIFDVLMIFIPIAIIFIVSFFSHKIVIDEKSIFDVYSTYNLFIFALLAFYTKTIIYFFYTRKEKGSHDIFPIISEIID